MQGGKEVDLEMRAGLYLTFSRGKKDRISGDSFFEVKERGNSYLVRKKQSLLGSGNEGLLSTGV